MPYQLPQDPSTARRARVTGWVTFGFAAVLIALVAYFGYVGYEGSRQFTDAPAPTGDCRTPATFGWDYEAINYDRAADEVLAAEPDPTDCAGIGATAGEAVAGPGDVGLAGWYVPAASGAPPDAPTVVLAHGWGSNKSAMLDRAAVLHDDYNLLLLDFRNHGQSQGSQTTQGVREAEDLEAMLDWLEASKGPDRIAVLGSSMGGASALAAAVGDERIDALIVESTHATLANAIQARLEREGYPLSVPAQLGDPARITHAHWRGRQLGGSDPGRFAVGRAAAPAGLRRDWTTASVQRMPRTCWPPQQMGGPRPSSTCAPRPGIRLPRMSVPRTTRAGC